MEERQRRVANSLLGRSKTAPRLRNQQVNRATLRGNGPFPRGLALPLALPPRTAGLDSRTMGRKKRAAPPSLLSSDPSGAKGSRLTTSRLARIRRRNQPHYRGRKCLNG